MKNWEKCHLKEKSEEIVCQRFSYDAVCKMSYYQTTSSNVKNTPSTLSRHRCYEKVPTARRDGSLCSRVELCRFDRHVPRRCHLAASKHPIGNTSREPRAAAGYRVQPPKRLMACPPRTPCLLPCAPCINHLALWCIIYSEKLFLCLLLCFWRESKYFPRPSVIVIV